VTRLIYKISDKNTEIKNGMALLIHLQLTIDVMLNCNVLFSMKWYNERRKKNEIMINQLSEV
jgi:hypothetical protein